MRKTLTVGIGLTAVAIPCAIQWIEDRDVTSTIFPDVESVRAPIAETSLGATTDVKLVLNTTSEEEHEVVPAPRPSLTRPL